MIDPSIDPSIDPHSTVSEIRPADAPHPAGTGSAGRSSGHSDGVAP